MSDLQPERIELEDCVEYRLNGKLHREGGPAVEWTDGPRQWWLNGQLHREDGPAVEWTDGSRQWLVNGEPHREDGPAFEQADGSRTWCRKGQRHREDGPAIELANGTREWWLEGRRHREDGPAVEWPDGTGDWWLNDQQVTEAAIRALWSRRLLGKRVQKRKQTAGGVRVRDLLRDGSDTVAAGRKPVIADIDAPAVAALADEVSVDTNLELGS